jgi:hypothetical protein
MEKISGLVLDLFDDTNGHVLKGIYPNEGQLPDFIKQASPVTPDMLERLPDDVFALILSQGDTTLRKYACIDAGHTALNIGYFLATHTKLPVEATKVAAANLITACGWYDIEPPEELKKLSTGNLSVIGRQRIWKDTDGATYGHDSSGWDLHKTADVLGTPDMPTQFGQNGMKTRQKTPLSTPKTAAELARLVDTEASTKGDEDTILEQSFGITEKNPASFPQVKSMQPHVNVAEKEPPKLLEKKEAQYYALPYERRYPLDSYSQVKAASAYFDQYHNMMSPDDRHTFAVNLLRRTEPLEVATSDIAKSYGQTKYASDEHIALCVTHRMQLLAPYAAELDVTEKTANVRHVIGLYQDLLAQRPLLSPVTFARTLGEIDKLAGLDECWDQDVVDPFASTFHKTAEEDATKDALVVGNEYMTLRSLKYLVSQKPDVLRRKFSEELVKELQADPQGIFESLPMEQKLVIMRIANTANETTAT